MGANDFNEMDGFPQETYELGELTATRKLICAWNDRYAVYLGFVPLTGIGATYTYPGAIATPAHAISGAIDPFEAKLFDGTAANPPKSDKESSYEKAIVTIVFKSVGAGTNVPIVDPSAPTQLISETIQPTNEFLKLDHTLFKWSSGASLNEPEAPGRQLHGFVWTVTRHKVSLTPSLNVELLTWANTINLNAIRSRTLGIVFGARTLLFMPARISRLDGNNVKIEMSFAYRELRWDKFWNVATQQNETIKKIDGTDYDNYPDQPFESKLGVFV